MTTCVRNIYTKNYQNLIIGFLVTVKNVGDVFLRHSVLFSLTHLQVRSLGEFLRVMAQTMQCQARVRYLEIRKFNI